MGTSLIASAPPTMATSTSPTAMASAAVVSACRLVAHARATECASMLLGSPAERPTSRAMFGHCTMGMTTPKTIWSTSLGGSSARCTSSETAIRPRSRAVSPLKAVPDFTNGVRRPATMAARRPVLVAMGPPGWVRRNKRLDAAGQADPSAGAQPDVPAARASVRRGRSGMRSGRRHGGLLLRLAHRALPAPLVDAAGARAARPQPPGREPALLAVVPAHLDPAVGRDRHVGGPYGCDVRLDLVEEAHGSCDNIPPYAPQRAVLPRGGASVRSGDAAPRLGAGLRTDGFRAAGAVPSCARSRVRPGQFRHAPARCGAGGDRARPCPRDAAAGAPARSASRARPGRRARAAAARRKPGRGHLPQRALPAAGPRGGPARDRPRAAPRRPRGAARAAGRGARRGQGPAPGPASPAVGHDRAALADDERLLRQLFGRAAAALA